MALALQMEWEDEDEDGLPDTTKPSDDSFDTTAQAFLYGPSWGDLMNGEDPGRLKAKHQSAALLQERDNRILQLRKDDGAFYSPATLKEHSSGTFDSLCNFTAYMRRAICRTCKGNYFHSPADVTTLFRDWHGGRNDCLS